MVKRRRLFYGGGCQNPHHLESMGKYLQWNATFFFTGSSALAKIVGPQEEDLHPWKRSHWSTPGSDSSDIQEGMVEDDEPHLDSSLDMTWQCVDDLDNAKRLVVVHQFLDLWFFFCLANCKSDLFALWRQFGQPAGIMTLCEAYANSCFDRTYVGALQPTSVLAFQCVPKKRWSAFGRKFAMFCLKLQSNWLLLHFFQDYVTFSDVHCFFCHLIDVSQMSVSWFLTAQHTPLQFPGWCPSSGGRDSAVVSSSVDVVCVCVFLKFPAKTI